MGKACFIVNTVMNPGRLLLYFWTNLLMFCSNIFDVNKIHRTAIFWATFIQMFLAWWSLALFPVTSVKNVLWDIIGFTIFHLFRTFFYGFTVFDLSIIFFYWRFVIYFISIEKWNKKGKYPNGVQIFIFIAWE